MGGMSTDWSSSHDYDWSSSSKVTRRSAADYAKDDDRKYTGTSSEGIEPPVGKDISTKSDLAAIIILDVTGSMRDLPELVIKKMPALYAEANAALQGLELDELKNKTPENKLEMAVIAVGDARGDNHPIQVVNFSKGPDLVNEVNKIFPEGGGGGNIKESYDLGLYYVSEHCKTPNIAKGKKVPLIIVGDEGFYEKVDKRYVKSLIGDDLTASLDSDQMIKGLMKDYDVYLIMPEMHYDEQTYDTIRKQWQSVLGPQRVMALKDKNRMVDTFVAVCAYAADNFNQGVSYLERRQVDEKTPDAGLKKIGEVLETMHPLLGKKAEETMEELEKKYHKKMKKSR